MGSSRFICSIAQIYAVSRRRMDGFIGLSSSLGSNRNKNNSIHTRYSSSSIISNKGFLLEPKWFGSSTLLLFQMLRVKWPFTDFGSGLGCNGTCSYIRQSADLFHTADCHTTPFLKSHTYLSCSAPPLYLLFCSPVIVVEIVPIHFTVITATKKKTSFIQISKMLSVVYSFQKCHWPSCHFEIQTQSWFGLCPSQADRFARILEVTWVLSQPEQLVFGTSNDLWRRQQTCWFRKCGKWNHLLGSKPHGSSRSRKRVVCARNRLFIVCSPFDQAPTQKLHRKSAVQATSAFHYAVFVFTNFQGVFELFW